MNDIHFLRPELTPTIYAYRILGSKMYEDSLKIGYTTRDTRTRIKEQIGTTGQDYEIVVENNFRKRGSNNFLHGET